MSKMIERMETPENLAAVREFYPEAEAVADGIHHMMVDQARTILTVTRLRGACGGTINTGQIEKYRKVSGLAVPHASLIRDRDKLCSCCGLNPRKGYFLCANCSLHADTDTPGQQVSIKNRNADWPI